MNRLLQSRLAVTIRIIGGAFFGTVFIILLMTNRLAVWHS